MFPSRSKSPCEFESFLYLQWLDVVRSSWTISRFVAKLEPAAAHHSPIARQTASYSLPSQRFNNLNLMHSSLILMSVYDIWSAYDMISRFLTLLYAPAGGNSGGGDHPEEGGRRARRIRGGLCHERDDELRPQGG